MGYNMYLSHKIELFSTSDFRKLKIWRLVVCSMVEHRLRVCSNFISVSMIRYPNQKQQRGEQKHLFGLATHVTILHFGQIKAGTQVKNITSLDQGRHIINAFLPACFQQPFQSFLLFRTSFLGNSVINIGCCLPTSMDKIFLHIHPMGQPDINNSPLRLSSKMILVFAGLTFKTK